MTTNKTLSPGVRMKLIAERRQWISPVVLEMCQLPPLPLMQITFIRRRKYAAQIKAEDTVPNTNPGENEYRFRDLERMGITELEELVRDIAKEWSVFSVYGEWYRHDGGYGCPFWPVTGIHNRKAFLVAIALSLIIYTHRSS